MSENKKPKYQASTPVDTGKDKPFWRNIGSAWESDKGISIVLDALPVNGKIVLFENKDEAK